MFGKMDGQKKIFFSCYGYDFTDIEQNFMFYIDAHDETENFVNLKGISMMELPLLKVEEEIFRRNDQ